MLNILSSRVAHMYKFALWHTVCCLMGWEKFYAVDGDRYDISKEQ